ncbi:PC4/YdbC family ssDNA-binding protein [Bosea sp. BK604]|uniref:transcriptional coactivator p15/PC4 family protein n=1 Tax=Bosea sp. BK604 TaxID=2512180 RepID=UPI001049DF5E|nr:PC4/YdbC family ssDNA-binding protein [Bosea sp. BK604]TCR60957.1 transcriptional coactivator p15 (PC4) [Bosea sp. BK604]
MSEHLIATIEKNRTEQIRVSLAHFSGHDICSVRVFFEADDGTWRPSPKAGLAFKVDKLPGLVEALTQAVAKAQELGQL